MEIPLFPLHLVLCPGIALPLHIFEPRYRLMIERLVADEGPFGIVLIREGREVGGDSVSIAGVGTLAEIRQAAQLPDGRYDIIVVGTGRFAIESVDADREPYLVAEVAPLDEELGDLEAATRLASRTMRRFVDYLHLLQPQEGESAEEIDVRIEVENVPDPEPAAASASGAEPEPGDPDEEARAAKLDDAARRLISRDDPTALSYLLSGIIQVDAVQRQVLLEADTTEERLIALDALIDRELWLLRRRLRLFTPDPAQSGARRN